MRKRFSEWKDKLEWEWEKKNRKTSLKPTSQNGSNSTSDDLANGLSDAMGGMSLGEIPYTTSGHVGNRFVGGFVMYSPGPVAGPPTGPPAFPEPSIQPNASYTPPPLPNPPRVVVPQPMPGYQPSLTMQYACEPSASAPPARRPQSLTMQHALSSSTAYLELDTPPDLPPRPHSDELLRHHLNDSNSASAKVPNRPSTLSVPRPQKQRASSEPLPDLPSFARKKGVLAGGAAVQCSGRTQKGMRCSRMVKTGGPALALSDPEGESERYCHQHLRAILTTSTGFYSRITRDWIKFSDWIPEYLDDATQAALRIDMERPLSSDDNPGYIYTFEIRDPDSPLCHLKTGRTNALNKRLTEWRKQCSSKEVVLRGWWPGTVNGEDGAGISLLDGRVVPGEPSAAATRTERLIHLELASLVMDVPYLVPGFPNFDRMKASLAGLNYEEEDGSDSGDYRSAKGKKEKGKTPALKELQRLNEPCEDWSVLETGRGASILVNSSAEPCLVFSQILSETAPIRGTRHKEIFSFIRPERGPLKNQEFEQIVKPVVEKWGLFTRTHLALP